MIDIYFARVGVGKTTMAAKLIRKEYGRIKKGKSPYKYIICNSPICGAFYVPSIKQFLAKGVPEDCYIVCDEASVSREFSNRNKSLPSSVIEFLKLHRHYNCSLVFISQSYEDLDVTIRRLYDRIFLMRKIFSFTLIQTIVRQIDVIDGEIKDSYTSFGFPSILYRRNFYKYFDTMFRPADVNYHCFDDIQQDYDFISYEKKSLR